MSPNQKKSVEKSQHDSHVKDSSVFENKDFDVNTTENESSILTIFSKLFFWGENDKVDQTLRKLDSKMPKLGPVLATIAMFLLGISIRGDWGLFAVYLYKYMQSGGSHTYIDESHEMINSFYDFMNTNFKGYFYILIPSLTISYVFYFGLGGFLHWYYYVRQRETPETWKCQPKKWLTPEIERHEILVGSLGLLVGSLDSAAFSAYVLNEGKYSKVYFNFDEYGYIWLLLQIPVVFMYQDYLTYWIHRIYHTPWLYKNFHKLHHTYKQPTAFSSTAIHPFEIFQMHLMLLSPAFIIPIHWLNFSILMMYIYYHAIIDHSGINFKRKWWQPWQPDCIFHDNHHQYFHVNFGFNMEIWDRLHGTYRRKDRIYNEDIFYGEGKSIEEATHDEIQADSKQRDSENPLAHREDYKLQDNEILTKKSK